MTPMSVLCLLLLFPKGEGMDVLASRDAHEPEHTAEPSPWCDCCRHYLIACKRYATAAFLHHDLFKKAKHLVERSTNSFLFGIKKFQMSFCIGSVWARIKIRQKKPMRRRSSKTKFHHSIFFVFTLCWINWNLYPTPTICASEGVWMLSAWKSKFRCCGPLRLCHCKVTLSATHHRWRRACTAFGGQRKGNLKFNFSV